MTEIIQGTDEWKQLRCGRVTASRVADIVAKTKTGTSASRANYMAQLICERLTGTVAESFTNSAMEHGTATEPLARAAYESIKDVLVDEVAFVEHPSIPMTGASPDGQIDSDGLIEIKCPNTATHIETLLSGEVPSKYITQMMWQMACTGRQWCDFVSFDNRLPADLQIFIKRILRDNKIIASLEEEVIKFSTELNDKITKLKNFKGN